MSELNKIMSAQVIFFLLHQTNSYNNHNFSSDLILNYQEAIWNPTTTLTNIVDSI